MSLSVLKWSVPVDDAPHEIGRGHVLRGSVTAPTVSKEPPTSDADLLLDPEVVERVRTRLSETFGTVEDRATVATALRIAHEEITDAD